MFDHKYPYTDIGELNLDWVIEKIKEMEHDLKNFINLNTIKYADPILWSITTQYEANTVVVDPATGNAFISIQPVPSGVSISNTDYWTQIYNYASELEKLREQIAYDEGSSTTATRSYAIDDLVFYNGGDLVRVTSPMIPGDSFVLNSNCVATTIAQEVVNGSASLNQKIDDEIQDRQDADTTLGGRIDDEIVDRQYEDGLLSARIDAIAAGGVFANVKNYGAVGDGVTDDTQAFQDALAANPNIYVPEDGVFVIGGVTLVKGARITGKGTLKQHPDATYLFTGTSIDDVEIYSVSIETNHVLYLSRFDAPMKFYQCSNVNIHDINIISAAQRNFLFLECQYCIAHDITATGDGTVVTTTDSNDVDVHDIVIYGTNENWGHFIDFYVSNGNTSRNVFCHHITGYDCASDVVQFTQENSSGAKFISHSVDHIIGCNCVCVIKMDGPEKQYYTNIEAHNCGYAISTSGQSTGTTNYDVFVENCLFDNLSSVSVLFDGVYSKNAVIKNCTYINCHAPQYDTTTDTYTFEGNTLLVNDGGGLNFTRAGSSCKIVRYLNNKILGNGTVLDQPFNTVELYDFSGNYVQMASLGSVSYIRMCSNKDLRCIGNIFDVPGMTNAIRPMNVGGGTSTPVTLTHYGNVINGTLTTTVASGAPCTTQTYT